jgi:hypothetical protein
MEFYESVRKQRYDAEASELAESSANSHSTKSRFQPWEQMWEHFYEVPGF